MNIEDIKKMRAETGAGVVEVKKALEESKWDYNKAKKILKAKGFEKAAKKAGRNASQGQIATYSHLGRIGAMVDLACETDFVARTELFKTIAHDLTLQVASMNPKTVEDLLKQPFIKDESITVADLIRNAVVKTGENIIIRRIARFELGEE